MPYQDPSVPLRVMLVDDQPDRALKVHAALSEAGYHVVGHLPSASGLLRMMESWAPDLVIIDLQSPDRDILDSCTMINQLNPVPIVMCSAIEDRTFMEQAIQAGVSAYLIEGINTSKVRPVLELAMTQFQAHQSLRRALENTQQELEARKAIEQAKGLLMALHHLSEDEAHANLRKLAMDNHLRMEEAARQVISILQKKPRGTPR